MKTVYKYPLQVGYTRVELPLNHKILSVQTQYEQPCVWVEVDTNDPLIPVDFEVYGTGHGIYKNNLEYCGTFQLHSGSFVGHVYKRLV